MLYSKQMQPVWLNSGSIARAYAGAVFADRDGTLLKHVDYLGDPSEVELLSGVADAVHSLLAANYAFFIFTNQSGVARGFYALEDVYACHSRMYALLGLTVEQLAGYCIATGLPESGDPYRKPSSRFIDEAKSAFALPADTLHMIGDTEVDLATAASAGIHSWLVGNGKPDAPLKHSEGALPYDYNYRPDFPACIDSILAGDFQTGSHL